METTKLDVTAEQINQLVRRHSKSEHETDKPFWYRVLKYSNTTSVCGNIVISFYWMYSGPNSTILTFSTENSNVKFDVKWKDARALNYRIVKDSNSDDTDCYIDILIIPNQKDFFSISTNLFVDNNAVAYSGNVESKIADGQIVKEYLLP